MPSASVRPPRRGHRRHLRHRPWFRILQALLALIVLLLSVLIARTGGTSATTPPPLAVRLDGQGDATTSAATGSGCPTATLTFTYTAVGTPDAVASTVGQTLVIQVTADRTDVDLVGAVATAPVGADGRAAFSFPAVGVPLGGARWTAHAVRLGATPVTAASAQPVTVGADCTRR